MSITVTLMINSSPKDKIGKTLDTFGSYECLLKEDTSIVKPTILIGNVENLSACNYMYIPALGRYYYIDNIVSVNNGLWAVSGHVDVLETYKDKILSNSAIIEGTERKNVNKYLYDNDAFVVNCKHKTDIITFPSGLNETGEFILITAGG